MQFIGLLLPAFVIPAALNLVISAYGVGPPTEEHPQSLPAPQATTMMEVANGIFFGHLPYLWMVGGGVIAIVVMTYDYFAVRFGLIRVPILALALGLYLPIEGIIFLVFICSYFLCTASSSSCDPSDSLSLSLSLSLVLFIVNFVLSFPTHAIG